MLENLSNGPSCLVLLIDDQRIIGEAIRRMLSYNLEIEFHYLSDPTLALDTAKSITPTVILLDLVMPGIDGLSILRALRADPATSTVPIIVLSSEEEPKTKAEAFSLGANDYLVKLPDRVELIARVRYHSSAYRALKERHAAYKALAVSQNKLCAELVEASKYVRSVLPHPMRTPFFTEWVFQPSSTLGGDSFGYFHIDEDHFAVFLVDVCNHGVGSALLSVSVMNALMGQTLDGVNFRQPLQVMSALNRVFQMEKHNNLYFTLWYGVFQRSTRIMSFSSAGHPPAVLMKEHEHELLDVRAMPVGALLSTQFKLGETLIPSGARLYIFSDGIYEVLKQSDGSMLQFNEFVELLEKPEIKEGQKVYEVLEAVKTIQGAKEFEDDVALVEIKL